MSTLVRLRRLFVPASTGLLVLIAAAWFIFSWVPSKRRYLDDRNFRVLNTLSEQLRFTINNFDLMMDNAAKSNVISKSNVTEEDSYFESYLHNVAPQLEKPEREEAEFALGKDYSNYSDPPKFAVVADEGTHFLYLAFEHNWKNKKLQYAIRTDLDRQIDKLLPPASRNPFDIVLVSKSDGTVIFQKALSGLNVTHIGGLNEVATKGKLPTPLPVDSLSQASTFEEVTLEGATYRLYSQPVKISFAEAEHKKSQAEPEKKSDKDAATVSLPKPWILSGLVRADHFQAESQLISYKYVLWLSAIILMVFAVYPFLRLRFSNCEERLRSRQVAINAVSICFIAAIVTFAFLDLWYWSDTFDRSADDNMGKLSAAIDNNFGTEKRKAFVQLRNFFQKEELRAALSKAETDYAHKAELARLTTNGAKCDPLWSCKVSILSDPDLLQSYPYLDYVGWSDFDSNQRVKWTTRQSITPFLRLDDPFILYYPDVKRALTNPENPAVSTPVPVEGVGTLYSPNTGKNVTVFWKLMHADGSEVKGAIGPKEEDKKSVFCISMTTNPLSVFFPILPAGFQFAVINSDGTVMFHSDFTRNLREDFFAETDEDPTLRSRVSMHVRGPLIANYMGRPHRLYIQPMSTSPEGLWTIVVFRDLHPEETMNLEMLSLASIMFFLYAGMLALVLLLVSWMRKGQVIGFWLWPDSRRTATYRRLVIVNILAALLLFAFSQLSSPPALILFGIGIPLGVIAFNLFVLSRDNDQNSTDDNKWRPAYIGASTTLLIVIVIMPCLSFFKVACDFEHKLFVQRGLLRLDTDIDNRAAHQRSRYQGLDLGTYAPRLLSGIEGQEDPSSNEQEPSFSYHKVLSTSIMPSQEHDRRPLPCGLGTPIGRQRCVELFLSGSSPPYNPLVADDRSLTEAGSSLTRVWSSSAFAAEVSLILTRPDRTITTRWTPFRLPLSKWQWWLSATVFMLVLYLLVRSTLSWLFLLDRAGPDCETNSSGVLDPVDLIATLSENLVLIGVGTCRIITNLTKRKDVEYRDISQRTDGSIDTTSFTKAAEHIASDGRPLVLRIVDRALDDPDSSRKIRLALERVLSGRGKRVVVISEVDPAAKVLAGESAHWETLLKGFVRIDLKSSPAQKPNEDDDQFDRRILCNAYYRGRFHELSRSQRLILVQLAQEGLINPNCQSIVCELLEEGLIGRRWGLLTINDRCFEDFLKTALPSNIVKRLERHGVGAGSAPLRMSLWVAAIGLVGFLIYTQGGDVLSTWVAYATGLAAAVPAFMKMFDIFRGRKGTEV